MLLFDLLEARFGALEFLPEDIQFFLKVFDLLHEIFDGVGLSVLGLDDSTRPSVSRYCLFSLCCDRLVEAVDLGDEKLEFVLVDRGASCRGLPVRQAGLLCDMFHKDLFALMLVVSRPKEIPATQVDFLDHSLTSWLSSSMQSGKIRTPQTLPDHVLRKA